MAKDFQQLKDQSRSGETIKKIRGAVTQSGGRWSAKRVNESLRAVGYDNLARKIRECRKGSLCGSVYCKNCRKRAAKGLEHRIIARVEARFKSDETKARDQLRHVTVLCELTSLELHEMTTYWDQNAYVWDRGSFIKKGRRREIDLGVAGAVKRARKDLNAFKRQFRNVWLQGAFEFELVDMDKLIGYDDQNQAKRNTLIVLDRIEDQVYGKLFHPSFGNRILVHFHGLMDLNGHNDNDVKSWLRRCWSIADRQVMVQRLRRDQPLDDSLQKIASYCFKNRIQSNMTFEARGFMGGDHFTNEELAKLVSLYDNIGKKGYSSLLIGIGGAS